MPVAGKMVEMENAYRRAPAATIRRPAATRAGGPPGDRRQRGRPLPGSPHWPGL